MAIMAPQDHGELDIPQCLSTLGVLCAADGGDDGERRDRDAADRAAHVLRRRRAIRPAGLLHAALLCAARPMNVVDAHPGSVHQRQANAQSYGLVQAVWHAQVQYFFI